ncbi:MAG TPA: hypothetical protein VEA63_14225 [Opitutus sp.]|nr:hypothetical protein [Opitutus sp.]
MQQPVHAWPRGATAGVLLALIVGIPLFAAILADATTGGSPNPKVAEVEVSDVSP